eukprot:CAMPEP_0197828918 /NCGR_PEP_ID=MMETSP1437-20131217/5414_1 /TAXON_ID=49252 ORGANISM="Eucampia antarctica, Strain CCMP1452" /NCGR_SAMPLE_ID=MMETSP1437 /ASSEMBLY_ACC=CAM_ASM_001096 /LENGTH=640 /DNA_ID=CAMNT_0043430335 /DNA_START=140 /DNA_END=2059 /DNA_ORIENTATION=+
MTLSICNSTFRSVATLFFIFIWPSALICVRQVEAFSLGLPSSTANLMQFVSPPSFLLHASVDESKSEWSVFHESPIVNPNDIISAQQGLSSSKVSSNNSSSNSSSDNFNNNHEAVDVDKEIRGGIDPTAVEIVPFQDVDPSLISSSKRSQPAFVRMFRGSAQYIANHRNTLVIYHIPGDLLEWKGFKNLMDDIAQSWLLGIEVILVTGCRSQLDRRLISEKKMEQIKAPKIELVDGIEQEMLDFGVRVTDINTLRYIKEEAGHVRFEVERQLARSLRLHGGLNRNGCDGNVLSGNFYSAQPFGVVDGVDYMYTGFPRRVEVEKIRQCLASNDIVLMTALGASPSGEVFNVNSESLAASVAGAMGASKVVYFTVHGTAFRDKSNNKLIQNLRYSDVKNLLKHNNVKIHGKGFATIDNNNSNKDGKTVHHTPAVAETLIKLGWAMTALKKGVKRAHIIAPTNGALLQELYTRDGSGTLISRDLYEGIRPANINDISGIYDLIQPLVNAGTLVPRSKAMLEKDIDTYYVYTRDNLVVACAQIKRFEGGFTEIGCLVVDKAYRSQGRGDAMLGYLERLSVQCGCSNVFVLSTQTMEWFIERGFKLATIDALPPSRKALYNYERRSKIYMKEITSDRDLDAAELW